MKSATDPETCSRGRILVVEDDPEAAQFFAYVLARRGRFEVTHTPDPAAALTLATAQPWDLLITDLELPGMSGLELLTALRPLAPRLPVVLVSALPLERAAHGVRPDAVLAKPVAVDVLVATAVALVAAGDTALPGR